MRVVRLYQSSSPSSFLLPPAPPRHHNCKRRITVGTTGPQQQVPDRTATASSRGPQLQRALPDLNCQLPSAVGTTGPQPQAPDRSGHYRTSTTSAWSQRALLDLTASCTTAAQPRAPDRSGRCRTATASSRSLQLSSVGLQCYTWQLNCSYPGYTRQLPCSCPGSARAPLNHGQPGASKARARARTEGREIEAGYLTSEL